VQGCGEVLDARGQHRVEQRDLVPQPPQQGGHLDRGERRIRFATLPLLPVVLQVVSVADQELQHHYGLRGPWGRAAAADDVCVRSGSCGKGVLGCGASVACAATSRGSVVRSCARNLFSWRPHSFGTCPEPRATRIALTISHGVPDADADPFRERSGPAFSVRKKLLGGDFRFDSASAALLQVVDTAYAGLPAHRFPGAAPEFRIELRLLPRQASPQRAGPPPVRMQSGAGLICGVMDASNYVVLAPAQQQALVMASEDMLDQPYHLR